MSNPSWLDSYTLRTQRRIGQVVYGDSITLETGILVTRTKNHQFVLRKGRREHKVTAWGATATQRLGRQKQYRDVLCMVYAHPWIQEPKQLLLFPVDVIHELSEQAA